MHEFLVETYFPRAGAPGLRQAAARARSAAAELRAGGIQLRYLRVIFVPDDEVCFHLFDAPNAGAVADAMRRAGLDYDRILAAIGENMSPLRARPGRTRRDPSRAARRR